MVSHRAGAPPLLFAIDQGQPNKIEPEQPLLEQAAEIAEQGGQVAMRGDGFGDLEAKSHSARGWNPDVLLKVTACGEPVTLPFTLTHAGIADFVRAWRR